MLPIYQRIPDLKTKLERMDKLPLTQAAIRSALQATLSKESFGTKNDIIELEFQTEPHGLVCCG